MTLKLNNYYSTYLIKTMVLFTKGPKFDDNNPARLELDGHHRGFKVEIYFSQLSSGDDGYVVCMTPYTGKSFNIQIGVAADPGYALIEDLIEDRRMPCKDKLPVIITWGLTQLSKEEVLSVFALMYKAGKIAGRNEVRKRFNQVMEIQ